MISRKDLTDEDRLAIKTLRDKIGMGIMDVAIAYRENDRDIVQAEASLRDLRSKGLIGI